MTLQFSQNVSPSNITDAMFRWKQFMVSVGWTITQSSDGSSFGAGDNISSSSSGSGGLGNSKAWFVLQQPGSFRSLCVQRGTADIYWRFKYSVGGFTSGSPSATRVPAGVTNDDNIIFGSGTDASPRFGVFSTGVNTIQIVADNATPYGFYFLTYPSGGSYLGNVIMLDPLVNVPSQDNDPYIVYVDSRTSSLKNKGINGSFSTHTKGYYKYGFLEQTFTNIPAANYFGSSKTVIPANIPVNPINGNTDIFPIFYALSFTTSLFGIQYKGVSSLMKWCGNTNSNGTLMTVSSPGDRVIFGDVSLPWNNTAVSL